MLRSGDCSKAKLAALAAGGGAGLRAVNTCWLLSANVRLERYKSGASGSGLRENIVKCDGKGITDGCN